MRGVIMAEKKKKPYEIGELDQYLFGQGNHYEIYKKLGAHLVQDGKQKGVYFAVWAPHAQAVSVVGEFNEWDTEANPMKREEPLGIYTCFIPGVKKNQMYKYCIETYSGEQIFKADPYANYAELRPGPAGKVGAVPGLVAEQARRFQAGQHRRALLDHHGLKIALHRLFPPLRASLPVWPETGGFMS